MHATDTLPLQAFMKPMIPNHASVAYKDRTLKPHFGLQNIHTFSFVIPLQPSNEGHSNNGQISRSNKGLAPVSWQAQNSARCILKLFTFLSEDKIYGYIFPRLVSKLGMVSIHSSIYMSRKTEMALTTISGNCVSQSMLAFHRLLRLHSMQK